MKFRFFALVCLICLGTIVAGLISLYRMVEVPTEQRAPLVMPPLLSTCLPHLESPQLKAQIESGETTYSVIGGYQNRAYQQILLADRHGQCYSPQSSTTQLPNNFLGAFVSPDLAKELWLQIYRQTIQYLGGRAVFQRQFNTAIAHLNSAQTAYLAPEQAIALKQLQIQIPESIQVITAQNYLRLLEQKTVAGHNTR